MASTMRATSTLASGSVSSLRVKPFTTALVRPTGAIGGSRVAPSVRARAAAVEDDLDFSFSLSDAKRGNEYSASDVEAAIRFYESGEGIAPAFDADFVSNVFGIEDGSFFDDIDNEDAYADEFIVAGIPEAAPKKRGRGRGQAGAQDEDDDVEQAKALDKVKALEDRMVLEAALEEEYGSGGSSFTAADAGSKAGVWDWLTDLESAEGAEGVEDVRAVPETDAGALTDGQVTLDIASASTNTEAIEDPNVQTYLELFSNDDLSEDVLGALGDEAGELPSGSSITDEELSRLDALVNEEIPVLNLKRVDASGVARLDDFPELEKSVVDEYIASLRAVVSGGKRATQAEVKALFGDEPLTVEAAPVEDAAAAKAAEALLATPEPKVSAAVEADFSAELAALEDVAGEVGEEDDGGLDRELRSLAAIEEFTDADFALDSGVVDELEGYVVAAEDYVAKEEDRKAAIVAAIARGELSADVLAEDLEEIPDAIDELLVDGAFDDNDAPDAALDGEDDGEVWVERIIELTRVTKVVKGGKIMGFRCVAIIGNQNGLVGVGCQAGREVAIAVKRTLVDARRNVVKVPLVGAGTVPHRSEAKYHAARCVVLPASDGTGCIAGGSVRSVLELAGVKNCLAKRIGSRSALNSARATVRALQQMQSLPEVSKSRGVPMEHLLLA